MDVPEAADPAEDKTAPEPDAAKSDATETYGADAFARLAIELHEASGVKETVETVLEFALQAEHCAHAGLILAHQGGHPEIAAVTDPVIEVLYQLQIDTDHGPMRDALAGLTTTNVIDVASDDRWPSWGQLAAAADIHSVLHVPLRVADQTVGVLSLYKTEAHGFSADDEAIAHILARHASVAVATARHDASLAQAVDARKLVGQAMGILMERFDIDADRAFAILRCYSQDTNTKLRDVAHQLINTRRLPR